MRHAIIVVVWTALLSSATSAFGQSLELSGGWAHATGNFGTDGFGVGAAYWLTPHVAIAANYDGLWDTSNVTVFALTGAGQVSIKSHLQNILAGPRIFIAPQRVKKYKVNPFAEVQFGASHLNSSITQVNIGQQSASDTAMSWMLGGGGDFLVSRHWVARADFDLLRTHFANAGQSQLRFVIGIVYNFGARE